jgi:outer membrane receptor protein involved in Fe transport
MRKSNLRATAAWQALALFGAGVLATPAMAQDAPPASGETSPPAEEQPGLSAEGQAEASDEAIVVTGSRLVRPELDAPSPVTTVDSETFDLTGTVTVETLLNELPQLIPGNTRTSNNQGGEDFSTLDLRGIGPNRTLILVDGERVPASSTSGVVDIGTIPAGLIERVDVVTGGASAVYGSDAMAGVVNFILKDNYEGMEVTGQYGISDHGDGASFNIQGLLGGNFADDRGNLTFFTSYYTRESIGQGDRDVTRNAGVVYYDYNTVTGEIFYAQSPGHLVPAGDIQSRFGDDGFIGLVGAGSGTPPWGWITNNGIGAGADDLFGTADDTGNPFGGGAIGNNCGPDGVCGVDADGPDNILGTDDDDHYDDTPIYADNGLGTILPDFFGAGNTDTNCDGIAGGNVRGGNLSFDDNGNLTPRNTSGICAYADRSTGSSRYNFNPVNYLITPYKRWNMALTGRYDISDAIRLKIVANYTDSSQEVALAPTPVTGLVIDPTLNPFIVANGACGVDSCHPDLLAALQSRPDPDAPFTMDRRWSESGPRIGVFDNRTATLRGTLSGPLAHGFNWDATLSYGRANQTNTLYGNTARTASLQGLAGCTDAQPIVGCVPVDIFGPNTLTPEMLSFTTLTTKETRMFDQARIAANITGNIVDLPAGPVGIAIGAEARTDRGDVVVDDAQRRGDMYGFNATQDQHGKLNVKELYGEVRIPILADMPFVHEFSVEAGARFSDYSSVGGLFNWKLGAQWAPTDWLKFRGIFNKAARAPSIVELFQNGDQGFPAFADFCNATGRTAVETALCVAQAPTANFAGFAQNNAQVEAFAFGNPSLTEENANTFTLGAVLTPNLGLGRFSATVDYYDIDIKDYVVSLGAQTFLNRCVATADPNSPECLRIHRDQVTGQIDFIDTTIANEGRLKTSGIDVGINYSVPFNDLGLGIGGRLRLQELLSWTDSFEFNGTELVGTSGGGIGGSIPEWKSTLTVAYDSDDFTAQMRWNYQTDLEDIAWCGPPSCSPDIPGLSYFDLSLRKSIGNNFELTGIVQNLFNQKAKHTAGGFFAEGGMDVAYWNPVILGRYFTIQGKVKL